MAYETHLNGSWFDETNLVAYYKLEDVNDSGPSGFNLTNANTATFTVAGKFSNCGTFVRASSQYLYINNNIGIDGGLITISAWVYPVSAPGAAEYYVAAEQANDTSQTSYHLLWGGTNRLWAGRWKHGVAAIQAETTTPLTLNTWTYLTLTYDNTNVRLYINGVYNTAASSTGNGTTGSSDSFRIGNGLAFNSAAYWPGKLDEIVVQNRAWTAAEVAKYYENSKGQFLGQVC